VHLSGEDRDYFAEERIKLTASWCSSRIAPRRIVDFGCGLGHSAPHIVAAFPGATVLGVDTSVRSIDSARRRYGSDRIAFTADAAAVPGQSIELVYSNGTFHHIEPPERLDVVKTIRDCLRPGGLFALWENNPWNPGTRYVMKKIPFDRDAIPLSPREGKRLLAENGFEIVARDFAFYFPASLKFARGLEPLLIKAPLGAQYCVLGRKV
jgi:trans-aconitate methyltransferase